MKAFEQGVSDGRGTTLGTAHRSTQKQAKGRGSSSHTLPAARHANENSDSGDDADAGDDATWDPDSYPKLRNKQRRRTGQRAELLNKFHVNCPPLYYPCVSPLTYTTSLCAPQAEIRAFLEKHKVHPSKKEPRVLPECVSNDDLARFHAEGTDGGS